MIGKRSAGIALALLGSASAAGAQEAPAVPARPRLALALSGGGARGIAHIGVLKAFEESGIPVDAIAGTSMGAVVGSIYATGRNAAELERTVKSLDWASIFSGQPDRRLIPVSRREDEPRSVAGVGLDFWKVRLPAGVFAEYRVNRFFLESLAGASYAAGGDFDRLPIPFHAIAAGLDDGRRVVLTKGDLARAVRASMSIPLAFPPVLWEGRPLVDGGVVDNLPVKEARTFGATVVVGIDIGSPALEPIDWGSAFGVAAQVNRLLSDRANAEFQEEPDVLVRPDLGKHSFNDYTGLDKLIMRGYEAGIRALPQIRERLGALATAPAPARPAPVRTLEGTPIAEVEVEGNERYSDALIRRTFSIPVGPPFDIKKGLNALDRIHATGFFDSVWMDMEPVEAGLRIVLRVKDGPANRVELGLGYDEEDGPRGFVQFKNRNTLGFGEQTSLTVFASNSSEGVLGRFSGDRLLTTLIGFEVRARALTEKPSFFDPEGEFINRAQFKRRDVRFALRRGIKRTWLFAAELNVGRVETVERLGLDFPLREDDVRTASFVVVHDNLDDPAYPRSRLRFELRGDTSATGLGAEPEFWRVEGSTRLAVPVGSDTTIQVDGWAGFSGDELPVYERYRLGGPVLLPGYHIEEQWGAQVLAASLTVRHQIFRSVHLVARAGAGNVWERREDIAWDGLRYGASLGLYRPTPIGPVAVDFGVRRGGETLATISIGFP